MKRISFILFFLIFQFGLQGQKTTSVTSGVVIAFWNVENLYDTIDDPLRDDDEFTPRGKLAWTSERYHQKIKNLSKVISEISSEVPGAKLGLIGLCEVENVEVLKDLVNAPALRDLQLQPLLIEGPDARGVDVALLYRNDFFTLKKTLSYTVTLPVDTMHSTRGILVASGISQGHSLCIIVNHWPSRRGGETASRPNRLAVSKKVRAIYDSISQHAPDTRIIVMGDFNDDPIDLSVQRSLGTVNNYSELNGTALFNPLEKLFKTGSGTLAWRDNWNLFDQILINQAWKQHRPEVVFSEARIYNKKHLVSDFGNYRNYPFRTYSAGAYTGGYSDHFPVFLVFKPIIRSD